MVVEKEDLFWGQHHVSWMPFKEDAVCFFFDVSLFDDWTCLFLSDHLNFLWGFYGFTVYLRFSLRVLENLHLAKVLLWVQHFIRYFLNHILLLFFFVHFQRYAFCREARRLSIPNPVILVKNCHLVFPRKHTVNFFFRNLVHYRITVKLHKKITKVCLFF